MPLIVSHSWDFSPLGVVYIESRSFDEQPKQRAALNVWTRMGVATLSLLVSCWWCDRATRLVCRVVACGWVSFSGSMCRVRFWVRRPFWDAPIWRVFLGRILSSQKYEICLRAINETLLHPTFSQPARHRRAFPDIFHKHMTWKCLLSVRVCLLAPATESEPSSSQYSSITC